MNRQLGLALTTLLVTGTAGCAVTSWLDSNTNPQRMVQERVEGLALRIASEGDVPNGTVDHFAVLLGANTELRHQGNLSMAYQVLVEQGYRRENIYILDPQPESTYFPATDFTTRETVTALFTHMKKIVEPQDTLLIYVTGHGRRVKANQAKSGERSTLGVSTILLNTTEEMSDWEFATLLEGLNPEVGIAFFDQCYGAIFAQTAKNTCNFVFITTAAEDETSYGVTFPRAFWGAFRAPAAASEMMSVKDAYEYARRSDRGTKMGYNRPVFTPGCVNTERLTLLGSMMPEQMVLSARAKQLGAGVEPASVPMTLEGSPEETSVNSVDAPAAP